MGSRRLPKKGNSMSNSQEKGFTIIETLVAVGVFAISLLAITTLAASLQTAHQNNQYLALANTTAKAILEEKRNSQNTDLALGTQAVSAASLPTDLPYANAQLTVAQTDDVYGMRKLTAIVTYKIGGESGDERQVRLTSYLGSFGLTQ